MQVSSEKNSIKPLNLLVSEIDFYIESLNDLHRFISMEVLSQNNLMVYLNASNKVDDFFYKFKELIRSEKIFFISLEEMKILTRNVLMNLRQCLEKMHNQDGNIPDYKSVLNSIEELFENITDKVVAKISSPEYKQAKGLKLLEQKIEQLRSLSSTVSGEHKKEIENNNNLPFVVRHDFTGMLITPLPKLVFPKKKLGDMFNGIFGLKSSNSTIAQKNIISQQSGLYSLPTDLIVYITKFLDFTSIAKFSRVSSKFFQICKEKSVLKWKDVVKEYLTDNPKVNDDKNENYYLFFKKFYPYLVKTAHLLETNSPLPQVFSLLYQLAGVGLDKLFYRIVLQYHTDPNFLIGFKHYQNTTDSSERKRNMVHKAVVSDNVAILNLLRLYGVSLLQRAQGSVAKGMVETWQDGCGEAPIHSAAKNGSINCLQILLDEGAKDFYYGYNALGYAIKNQHLNCIKLLVESGHPVSAELYELAQDECAEYLRQVMEEKGISIQRSNSCIVS